MNVQKGDLAYVTSGAQTPGLAGRFVIVESFVGTGVTWVDGLRYAGCSDGWLCTPAGGGYLPAQSTHTDRVDMVSRRVIDDEILRPIRPQSDDKIDEMLLIAGKPNEVTA